MKKFTYDYPRPAVASDIAIFMVADGALNLLLIRRKLAPFAGTWALPGGFLREDETLDACAARELQEETGLNGMFLRHFANFSDPNRDPRGRVISVAYFALIPWDVDEPDVLRASTDAEEAKWFPIDSLPELAFDHGEIVRQGRQALVNQVRLEGLPRGLLPDEFTFAEFQGVHEAIEGRNFDKRNFRRKIMKLGLIEETGNFETGSHRPAAMFRTIG